ncbi:MAG: hypothetical protein V3V37_08025 [Candidatus Adiutricales bacterium]
MFRQREIEKAIRAVYPDLDKFSLIVSVKKDRLFAPGGYIINLAKDQRKIRFKLDREEVIICLEGNRCQRLNEEFTKFIRQFIDEKYALPESG